MARAFAKQQKGPGFDLLQGRQLFCKELVGPSGVCFDSFRLFRLPVTVKRLFILDVSVSVLWLSQMLAL